MISCRKLGVIDTLGGCLIIFVNFSYLSQWLEKTMKKELIQCSNKVQ